MKTICCFLYLMVSTQILVAQIDSALAEELQGVLDNSVSNLGNNGVSSYLIMPNGEVWSGTSGFGKNNLPITDTTLFHGASTTKFNVAILMLLLVEEGLVNLDLSWNNYVSLNLGFDTLITVRQLLNHTSGIADYLETSDSGNNVIADFDYFYSPHDILENIVSEVPDFSVGTGFRYSNSNYVLAGLIVESVTGNPVHLELRNRIWNPLDMNHTYFGAYETYAEPTAGVWWDFGSGLNNYSNMPTTSMLSYAYGAGNIVSCPSDLTKLLRGVFDGELLTSQALDEMMNFVPASFNGWTAGYGLGIHHANVQSENMVVGHDGYYSNLTDMFHNINCGFTLVTMSNTQTSWFGIFNPMHDILVNYCTSTAVRDIETKAKPGFKVFPNPTQNQIKITSEQVINSIEIRGVSGDLHSHIYPNSRSISFLIEQEGLYFISLKIGDQFLRSKLIVKN